MSMPAPEIPIGSVALFVPAWPPGSAASGIVSYAAVMREALRELGVGMLMLPNTLYAEPGDEVASLDEPLERGSCWARGERRFWQRIDPERAQAKRVASGIAHALGRRPGISLVEMEETRGWASQVARRCDVPIVVRLHGPWFLNGPANGVPIDARFRRRDRAERLGLLAANAISAPCRDVLERTRAHFGLPLEDAVVIPNPIAPVSDAVRWQLAASDPNELLFVGRFDRHKGGDVVIEAFARVAAKRPQVRLTFAGPDLGAVDSGAKRWTLEQLAADRLGDTRPRLQWVGPQPRDRIGEMRRQARVVVVASRYENFPYTALEAMATGCPLVSTRAGGLAEVVEEGRNALTCIPDDAEALAGCILRLLEDSDLAARLGAQALRDSRDRYDPQVVARSTLAFYRDVLDRARAS
jgi:glycosyltransferase involved in cell wall biosynthesis